MRVGVVDFAAQAPLVLQTQTGLEAVVAAVGGVFFLLDLRVSLIGAVDVAVGRLAGVVADGNGAAIADIGR